MSPSRPPSKGLPANRVEALSDGVFAIAMTVLVLNLQVPEGGDSSDLAEKLLAAWPKLASYAMSFVMLAVLWIGHHFQFNYIRSADRVLLWINVAFLLLITFLPFTTAVLANYYRTSLAVVLYGLNLLAAGSSLIVHWNYATTDRRLVPDDLPDAVITSVRRRIAVGLGIYVFAIVVGLFEPRASLVVFVLMPLMYLARTGVDRHVAGK